MTPALTHTPRLNSPIRRLYVKRAAMQRLHDPVPLYFRTSVPRFGNSFVALLLRFQ
jgi:hypothetical protein